MTQERTTTRASWMPLPCGCALQCIQVVRKRRSKEDGLVSVYSVLEEERIIRHESDSCYLKHHNIIATSG